MNNSTVYLKFIKDNDNCDITLMNLYDFYSNKENLQLFLSIIVAESNISIRLIDWFVTNYAKKNNIIYKLDDNDSIYFNVYVEYKCQLKSYKKKLFDPFCRKNKIYFYYNLHSNINDNKGSFIITTIGQLNFYKWAIKYNVINYIENNLDLIYQDMSQNHKNNSLSNTSSSETTKKKRHELSNNSSRIINIHNYSITLNLD